MYIFELHSRTSRVDSTYSRECSQASCNHYTPTSHTILLYNVNGSSLSQFIFIFIYSMIPKLGLPSRLKMRDSPVFNAKLKTVENTLANLAHYEFLPKSNNSFFFMVNLKTYSTNGITSFGSRNDFFFLYCALFGTKMGQCATFEFSENVTCRRAQWCYA